MFSCRLSYHNTFPFPGRNTASSGNRCNLDMTEEECVLCCITTCHSGATTVHRHFRQIKMCMGYASSVQGIRETLTWDIGVSNMQIIFIYLEDHVLYDVHIIHNTDAIRIIYLLFSYMYN